MQTINQSLLIPCPLNSMPEYDRKTQHIAEKVRRGETVPELRNLSRTFTKMRSMPVDCKPNTAYGSSLI